jgi:hypothetical protein
LSSKSAASRRVVMRRDFQSMEGFYAGAGERSLTPMDTDETD